MVRDMECLILWCLDLIVCEGEEKWLQESKHSHDVSHFCGGSLKDGMGGGETVSVEIN